MILAVSPAEILLSRSEMVSSCDTAATAAVLVVTEGFVAPVPEALSVNGVPVVLAVMEIVPPPEFAKVKSFTRAGLASKAKIGATYLTAN